jgi:hypothetical protein
VLELIYLDEKERSEGRCGRPDGEAGTTIGAWGEAADLAVCWSPDEPTDPTRNSRCTSTRKAALEAFD